MDGSALIGREHEVERLEALLDRVELDGSAALLAVLGEPGIGKSRLLGELGARADERGHLMVAGRAAEFERDLPFGVFVDALDDYLASVNERALETLRTPAAAELGAVFPSLSSLPERDAPEAPDRRHRTHRAVRTLLTELASPRPMTMLLDDVHWADPASVDLILHLLRREPKSPLVLALALRPGAAPPRLTAAIEAAAAEGRLERLELVPLDDAAVDAFVGDRVDAQVRRRLRRDSGGNPFYLEQLLRASVRDDAPRATGPGALEDGEVPASVLAAIAHELDGLGEAVRCALHGAAVAGEPFEPDIASEAAGISEDEFLAALDVVLEADVVRPTAVPRRFRFRHPIVRHAVYESAGEGWRSAAHARAAAALERRGDPGPVRASHVERSARVGDEAAIALLTEAGNASAPRAPATAARWYGAALRLLPGDDPWRRLALLGPLARSLGASGRLDESEAALREVLELLPAEMVAERAQIVAYCAKIEHLLGRHGQGRALLVDALAGIHDQASPEAVALKVELTSDCFFSGDFEGMGRWAQEALEAAESLDDLPLRAAAEGLRAGAAYMTGRIPEAKASVVRAGALLDAMSDEELAQHLNAAAWFGWTEVFLERFDDALRHLERGLAVAGTTGQGHLLVLATIGQANVLLCTGRLAEAADLAESAIESAMLSGGGPLLAWALTQRCWVDIQTGDLDGAVRHGEQGLEAGGDDIVSILAGCYLAEARLEAGEPRRARDDLLAATGGADMPPIEEAFRPRWYELLARAEVSLGDLPAARGWAERAWAAADGLELGGRTAAASRALALVALAESEAGPAGAVAAAELALAGVAPAEASGAPVEAARCRTLAGRALAAAGEREAAVSELIAAEGALKACGAEHYRAEAVRELRRLGRRAPRPAPAEGLPALSGRERDVAGLVAVGLTNRQIAGELVISEKTVESHLSHVFAKLGVHSRAEVAVRVSSPH